MFECDLLKCYFEVVMSNIFCILLFTQTEQKVQKHIFVTQLNKLHDYFTVTIMVLGINYISF